MSRTQSKIKNRKQICKQEEYFVKTYETDLRNLWALQRTDKVDEIVVTTCCLR